MHDKTMTFSVHDDRENEMKEILTTVYDALKQKGYNPINQLVGYILSEDPTYITTFNNARGLIRHIDRDELLGAAGAVAAERKGDKAVALGGVVIQVQVAKGVLGGELCVIVKEGQARLRHAADLAAAPEEVGKEFIGARGAAALVGAREGEGVHDAAGILQAEHGEILPVRAHGGAHEVARAGIPDIDGLAGGVIHRDGALIACGVRADGEIAAVAQVGADDLPGGLDIGLAALEIRHAQRRAADVIGAHALAADGDARLREREDLVQDGLAVFIEQLQAARGDDRETAVHRAEGAAGAGVERVGRAVIQIVARRAGPVAQQQIQKQQHGQHAHRHDDGLPQPGISFLVVVHGHSSPIRRADAASGLIHHIADGAVVPHAVEIQPLRGHGRPRKTPVARGQQRRDGLRLDLAVGRIDHRADDGTHHITEKAVGTDSKYPGGVFAFHLRPFGMGDVADVCFYICMQFAETCKINVFEQGSCSLVHPFIIQ